jgi:hypothetical protein
MSWETSFYLVARFGRHVVAWQFLSFFPTTFAVEETRHKVFVCGT